ncbi:MAG: hypothetical protein R6U66_06075 [Bacteroidales bacterium]
MSIFALKKLTVTVDGKEEPIDGAQKIEKLLIDNECQFDDFESDVLKHKKYINELGKIYAYIEFAANGSSLPSKKFKDITPAKENVKEYEFKTKNLRVYAIKTLNGKIVIFGGYKNQQKKDIRKFRSIKKRYLESIKPRK